MSGVANEDSKTPDNTGDAATPVDAAPNVEGAAAQSGDDTRANPRRAAYLRVVADNETPEAASTEIEDDRPTQRIGAHIRSVRENLGLTLEQVSKDTRITVSHLRAIEEMTPNLIGVPVYVQGHVRTYARHLKLDAEAILQRYKTECALLSDPEKPDITPPATGRKGAMAAPVLGLLTVALIGGGAFAYFSSDSGAPATPGTAAAAAGPDVASGAAAAIVTPPLRIVALERGHIEVRSSAGDKFLDREFAPGESYTPRVGAGWTVSVRNGAAFEWRLGEHSLGLVAAEGGPVYAQSVDAAAQRAPIAIARPVDTTPTTPATVATTGAQPVTILETEAQPPAAAAPPRPRPAPSRTETTAAPAATAETAPPPPAAVVEIAPPTPQNDPSLEAYSDN